MDNEKKEQLKILESKIKAELNDLKNEILELGNEGKVVEVADPKLAVRIRIKNNDLQYSFKYGDEWEVYKPYDSIYWVEDDFQIDTILRNKINLVKKL
jgi:hypothetical protein